jgi:hypothetical protein
MATVLPGGLPLLTIEVAGIAIVVFTGVILLVWRRHRHAGFVEIPDSP